MSGHKFVDRDGSTPLDPNQVKGLKFTHLTTMRELDELEDINIQNGIDWLHAQTSKDCLSLEFLCKLHQKLFGDVWKWAGKIRTIDVNITKIRYFDVAPQLKNLFEDAKLWIDRGKVSWDIISAELHHRLIYIHPFPNGNGRTTRLFTEHIQRINQQPVTSWKLSMSDRPKERRAEYIEALKKADGGEYGPLIEFMREKI